MSSYYENESNMTQMQPYEFWCRQREGGGTQIISNDKYVEKDKNDSLFINEVKNIVESIGYSNTFYENMEPIFKRIERENNVLNPTALILAMKFAVNPKEFIFVKNSYYNFNKFLQEQWKIIDDCLIRYGNNYFDMMIKSNQNLKIKNEEFIRYKIFKSKLKHDSHQSSTIQRYLAIWKREIFLYQEKLRRNHIRLMNEREKYIKHRLNYLDLDASRKPSLYIYKINELYQSNLQKVRASNGTNACWINSVLYVFLSNSQMKTSLIYNKFISKDMIDYVKSLIDGEWDDKLYNFYYKIFKKHCDDVVAYGQYGTPHFILSFIIEEMINNNNSNFKIDMDFSITIYTIQDLKEKLSNQRLFAVLKGITKMNPLNYNDEVNSDHFVSFIRKKKSDSQWILFDAMKGGTVDDEVKEQYIFSYDNLLTETGSCPYFFIYFHDDLKK